jgi:hypothetical protein
MKINLPMPLPKAYRLHASGVWTAGSSDDFAGEHLRRADGHGAGRCRGGAADAIRRWRADGSEQTTLIGRQVFIVRRLRRRSKRTRCDARLAYGGAHVARTRRTGDAGLSGPEVARKWSASGRLHREVEVGCPLLKNERKGTCHLGFSLWISSILAAADGIGSGDASFRGAWSRSFAEIGGAVHDSV